MVVLFLAEATGMDRAFHHSFKRVLQFWGFADFTKFRGDDRPQTHGDRILQLFLSSQDDSVTLVGSSLLGVRNPARAIARVGTFLWRPTSALRMHSKLALQTFE